MVQRTAEPWMSLTQPRSAGKRLPFLLFEGIGGVNAIRKEPARVLAQALEILAGPHNSWLVGLPEM